MSVFPGTDELGDGVWPPALARIRGTLRTYAENLQKHYSNTKVCTNEGILNFIRLFVEISSGCLLITDLDFSEFHKGEPLFSYNND